MPELCLHYSVGIHFFSYVVQSWPLSNHVDQLVFGVVIPNSHVVRKISSFYDESAVVMRRPLCVSSLLLCRLCTFITSVSLLVYWFVSRTTNQSDHLSLTANTDSACWIGQKPASRGPTSADGVGHNGPTRVTDTHRWPNKDRWPTVGLVCPYLKKYNLKVILLKILYKWKMTA